jgi:hypothetical protein
MTERSAALSPSARDRSATRFLGRVAQFLLGIPLGLFQLTAVLVFTFTGAVVTAQDWFVAIWGIVMSASCTVLALRVYRSVGARRVALALLGVQGLFSLVKGLVYHETAALVFGAIVAATLVALGVYHRARATEGVAAGEAA